jgi:hypothetical protein
VLVSDGLSPRGVNVCVVYGCRSSIFTWKTPSWRVFLGKHENMFIWALESPGYVFSKGEIEGYFKAVDWLATTGDGWKALYLGAGGGMGMECRFWKNGEVMAVPNGENEGGIRGSGRSIVGCCGLMVGREGAILVFYPVVICSDACLRACE